MPTDAHRRLMEADSKGRIFNREIRNAYTYRRVERSLCRLAKCLNQIEQAGHTLPRIYETEDIPLPEKTIRAHLFMGDRNWYVAEWDGQDEIFCFACLGDPQMSEWGYADLAELSEVQKFITLKSVAGGVIALIPAQVEVDRNWVPMPFREIVIE